MPQSQAVVAGSAFDLEELHYEYDWAWEDQTRGLPRDLGGNG